MRENRRGVAERQRASSAHGDAVPRTGTLSHRAHAARAVTWHPSRPRAGPNITDSCCPSTSRRGPGPGPCPWHPSRPRAGPNITDSAARARVGEAGPGSRSMAPVEAPRRPEHHGFLLPEHESARLPAAIPLGGSSRGRRVPEPRPVMLPGHESEPPPAPNQVRGFVRRVPSPEPRPVMRSAHKSKRPR